MTRRQAGFTLVELLLAVTLMGLLLALAYGGLRAASRASEGGQQVLEESGRLRITHQFVRKQINLMLPLAWAGDDEEDLAQVVFEGFPERITFVGPMPGYLARGGPQVQVLEFVEGERGLRFQFNHAPLQGFDPEWLLERDPVVLLDGLSTGGFEFLEVDEDGAPVGWTGEWLDGTVLPSAVRLDLVYAETASVTWPPLVAQARLDPTAIIPGAGGDQSYAQKIQEMIRQQSQQGQRD